MNVVALVVEAVDVEVLVAAGVANVATRAMKKSPGCQPPSWVALSRPER